MHYAREDNAEPSKLATAAPTPTYAVAIEWGPRNYSAYAPDLPGCVSTGKTVAETTRNIQEAIALHLEGMREDGEPIPELRAQVTQVSVRLASGEDERN